MRQVFRTRVRIDEWTRDYDKARTRRMRKSQFRRALDLCNLGLHDSELCRLEDHYQSVGHPEFVDYLRFSDDIEAIFAQPHLERAPEVEPRLFSVPDETQCNEIVVDKQQVLDNCLRRIAKRVITLTIFCLAALFKALQQCFLSPFPLCVNFWIRTDLISLLILSSQVKSSCL